MKTRYIIAGLLMSVALSVSARTYVNGERIYINVNQSFNWRNDNAKLYVYLFQSWSSGTKWAELSALTGDIYEGTISTNGEEYYDRIIVVRKDPNNAGTGWGGTIWNQTCDIEIPQSLECNYLYTFTPNTDSNCSASQKWYAYAPPANKIAGFASSQAKEDILICTDAAEGPMSLKAKLKADKSDYDYSNVHCHAWYASADMTTWTCVDGLANNPRDGEHYIDTMVTLPVSLKTAGTRYYYYLHSADPAGRRLIRLTSQVCALDCEITSFETAVSNVNADNNTYTLDGMVAFGEPNGDLVITCDGKTTVIQSPKSPQSFSLEGVPAATEDGKTTTATAYFVGDQTNCSQTITINVPNAKEAVQAVQVDSLTGRSIVLTPVDYDPANAYVWLANGDTIVGAPQVLILDPFEHDSTVTYTYKEYYPASGDMEDMMKNGSYEEDADYGMYGHASTISEYNFWGLHNNLTTVENFYDTCSLRPSHSAPLNNGFAVVQNSNHFAPSYAKVTARDGSHFALFDAALGTEGGNKMAWYATTTQNEKLKIKKGTTYVLSFWAANINNYGEMDNAARFVFRIEYGSKVKESKELNLANPAYRNNLWHQCSQTFTADEDADFVRISVVNKNINKKPEVGNDFALDDIQFHPISSVSKVVKSQQQFIVTAHEPKIDAFTATVQPVDCDGTDYTIAMHVDYQNPDGQLIIKDITTNTEYSYDIPAVNFDTPASLDEDILITTNEPTHDWQAYFADWTTAQKTASTDIPGFPHIDTALIAFAEPACTDLTTTLTFNLNYTYQQGDLTYWVDNQTAQTSDYSEADKTAQTLVGLTFASIPADGKDNHVLHVSFDGANSCVKDYTLPTVPFSPVISEVAVSAPTLVACDANNYTATLTITTPYDATGRNIIVSYEGKQTIVAATGTSTTVDLTLTAMGGTEQTIRAAYEATPDCTTDGTYTAPTHLACNLFRDTICEGEDYTLNGFNIIAPPVGEGKYVNAVMDTLLLTVGDAHVMYSKWTDVLFISNADNRFVSYQWFNHGQAMTGETSQRLYDPNGLPGLYYCRMTTTDGQIIITCEYTFDEVTPSRTLSEDTQAKTIAIYDTMGRLVTGKLSKGIYLIVTEKDGERITTKTIINE